MWASTQENLSGVSDNFQNQLFQKIISGIHIFHQSVKQFGSKLFAKVISRQHVSAYKERVNFLSGSTSNFSFISKKYSVYTKLNLVFVCDGTLGRGLLFVKFFCPTVCVGTIGRGLLFAELFCPAVFLPTSLP